MKKGEKKFDGYNPETNTLIDAKEWEMSSTGPPKTKGWPPEGDSKFDQMIRDQEAKNIQKDAQIAADKGSNLEYHVPSEAKRQQILEILGDDIPNNFYIVVTPK